MPARAIPAARRGARARPPVAQPRRRGRPGAGARARPARHRGLELMSARTRELFGLLPVTLLVAAGFAAVLSTRARTCQRDAHLRARSSWACACSAHLFIRARLPEADPYMFPLAAVLAGIGLVLIYRIDAELAREQAQWFVVGLAFFCVDDSPDRRPPRAGALPLHDRGGQHRAAGDAPAAGNRRAGERRVPRDQGRADPVPARGVREARDHHLPRELPARDGRHPRAAAAAAAALPAPAPPVGDPGGAHAARDRGAGPRAGGIGAARRVPVLVRRRDPGPAVAQALRPAAARLGARDADADRHPRPRQLADVLRRLPGAPLGGHGAAVADRRGLDDVLRRRLLPLAERRAREGARGHLARPVRAGAS